jgi:hypothetical protein
MVGDSPPLLDDLLEFLCTELLVSIPAAALCLLLLPLASAEVATSFPLADTGCVGAKLVSAGKPFDGEESCLVPFFFLLTVSQPSELVSIVAWSHYCSS